MKPILREYEYKNGTWSFRNTILRNAMTVTYHHNALDLWTGSFQLPVKDPMNQKLGLNSIIQLYDGDKDAGLYRVKSIPASELRGDTPVYQYDLEHVLSFLTDSLIGIPSQSFFNNCWPYGRQGEEKGTEDEDPPDIDGIMMYTYTTGQQKILNKKANRAKKERDAKIFHYIGYRFIRQLLSYQFEWPNIANGKKQEYEEGSYPKFWWLIRMEDNMSLIDNWDQEMDENGVTRDWLVPEKKFTFKEKDILSCINDFSSILTRYYWEFDTTGTGKKDHLDDDDADTHLTGLGNGDEGGWYFKLKAVSDTPTAVISYGRNSQNISRSMDMSNLCTRVFVVGKNEEDAEIEGHEYLPTIYKNKKPYDVTSLWVNAIGNTGMQDKKNHAWCIDNVEGIKKYGVIVRATSTDSTKVAEIANAGVKYLVDNSEPVITYSCTLIDLYRITGKDANFETALTYVEDGDYSYNRIGNTTLYYFGDNIDVGTCVQVTDTELGIDVITHVVSIEKSDVDGDPLNASVTLSTRVSNTESALGKIVSLLLK